MQIARGFPRVHEGRFALPLVERRILLMVLDLLAVNGALWIWLHLRPEIVVRPPHWFLLVSVLYLLAAFVFDAYEPRVSVRFPSTVLTVAKAGLMAAALFLLIPYLPPPLPTARSQVNGCGRYCHVEDFSR